MQALLLPSRPGVRSAGLLVASSPPPLPRQHKTLVTTPVFPHRCPSLPSPESLFLSFQSPLPIFFFPLFCLRRIANPQAFERDRGARGRLLPFCCRWWIVEGKARAGPFSFLFLSTLDLCPSFLLDSIFMRFIGFTGNRWIRNYGFLIVLLVGYGLERFLKITCLESGVKRMSMKWGFYKWRQGRMSFPFCYYRMKA